VASGARVLHERAHASVAVHNLEHLKDLARSVERVLKE